VSLLPCKPWKAAHCRWRRPESHDPAIGTPLQIARTCDRTNWSDLNRTNLQIAQSCDPAIVSNRTIVRPTQKKGTTSIPPLRSLQYIFADMPVLQQTAESKAKAIQEIRETGFLNYDVLLAHHPDADNHFAGVPSKDAIAYMFNSNMVNGIHALCQYPFPDDYDGPVFPMFLVEHQPMDLTGQLDTDEKLNRWEEDMYEQYSEITPDNCPPVRMARAICHSRDTKTVFIGDSVKIAGIATKKNQTEEAAAIVASIDVAIENLIAFLKSYYIDAAPCSSHDAINDMKKKASKGQFGLPKSDCDYLLGTKQIRTVKKTHNSTNYLFCERCMKKSLLEIMATCTTEAHIGK
jgi:hypothetical protein